MADRHVVALEEVVDRVLPVDGKHGRSRLVAHEPLGAIGREPLRERAERGLERLGLGREVREHEPGGDADVHGPEAVLVAVEPGEAGLLGHGKEPAVEAVRPAVVRAADRLAAVAGAVEDPGGPVPADVREAAQLAVGSLDNGDRLAGDAHADVVARLLELRDVSDEQPLAAPDRAPLGPVELGRAVDPGRERADRLGAHAAFPFASLAGPQLPCGSRDEVAVQVARRPQAEQHLAAPLVDAGGQPARRRPRVDARPGSSRPRRPRRSGRGSARASAGARSRRARGRRRCGPSTATSRSRPPSSRGSPGRRRPTWRTASRPSAAGADGLELGVGDRIGQVVGMREGLLDHIGPAREVVVDERRRDTGLPGDIRHAQPRRSGLGDHPAGGVEDGVLAIGGRLGHHCLS